MSISLCHRCWSHHAVGMTLSESVYWSHRPSECSKDARSLAAFGHWADVLGPIVNLCEKTLWVSIADRDFRRELCCAALRTCRFRHALKSRAINKKNVHALRVSLRQIFHFKTACHTEEWMFAATKRLHCPPESPRPGQAVRLRCTVTNQVSTPSESQTEQLSGVATRFTSHLLRD